MLQWCFSSCTEGSVGAPSMHSVWLPLNTAMLTSAVSRATGSRAGSWLREYSIMLELNDSLPTCFEQLRCPAGPSGLAEPDLAVPACWPGFSLRPLMTCNIRLGSSWHTLCIQIYTCITNMCFASQICCTCCCTYAPVCTDRNEQQSLTSPWPRTTAWTTRQMCGFMLLIVCPHPSEVPSPRSVTLCTEPQPCTNS